MFSATGEIRTRGGAALDRSRDRPSANRFEAGTRLSEAAREHTRRVHDGGSNANIRADLQQLFREQGHFRVCTRNAQCAWRSAVQPDQPGLTANPEASLFACDEYGHIYVQ
jgi:hypothetical protein